MATEWQQRFGALVLNINVPQFLAVSEEEDAFSYTFQSNLDLFQYQKPPERDFSKPFRLPSEKTESVAEQAEIGSDLYTVCLQGRISLTPVCGNYTLPAFLEHTLK